MPSQNEEYNKQPMHFTSTASAMAGYYAEGIEDDVTAERFEINSFDNYFPDLHFFKEYLPLGTSKPFCLHLDWIKKEQASLLDRYNSVQNLPYCQGAVSPKVRWDSTYPSSGIDFQIFTQGSKEAKTADECDSDSQFYPRRGANNGGFCFSYKVVDAVCVRIAYVADPARATYSWQFVDGCFENGSIVHYSQAKPDTIVDFSRLPIEVRQTYSLPQVTISTAPEEGQEAAQSADLSQQASKGNSAWIFALLGHIFLLAAFVCGAYIVWLKMQKNSETKPLVNNAEM